MAKREHTTTKRIHDASWRTWLALVVLVFAQAFAPTRALDPSKRFADYVIDNWNLEDGLPQVAVLTIQQDADGYIWVGTQNGLARFDGMRFDVYNRRSASGIHTTLINTSFRDRDGVLWFGTARSLIRQSHGELSEMLTPGAELAITGIAQDTDGTVIVTTSGGLFRVHDGQLQADPALTMPLFAVLRVGDTLWLGGRGEVLRREGDTITRIANPLAPDAALTQFDHDGERLWVASEHGLFRVDGQGLARAGLNEELDQSAITAISHDGDGNLWVGTLNALFRQHRDHGMARIAEAEFGGPPRVRSLFVDRDGNLWIGSYTESMFRVWNGWARRLGRAEGVRDTLLWSLERDSAGRLLLGTNSNVQVFDQGRFREYIDGALLPNPVAYEMYLDPRDRLWLGTRAGLAWQVDGRIEQSPGLAAVGRAQVNAVVPAPDSDDVYWIGTQDGLFRYERGVTRRISVGGDRPQNHVRAILPLSRDRAWIGTEAGLREINGDIESAPDWAEPLRDVWINGLTRVDDGFYVAATMDSGMALIRDQRVVLANGELIGSSWRADRVGDQVYFSSMDGVFRLRVDDLERHWRDPSIALEPDYLISISGFAPGAMHLRCCNGGARSRALPDVDGIWYPSQEGLLRLEIPAIHVNDRAPVMRISQARTRDRAIATDSGAIELMADERELEVAYTAIEFRDPKGVRFEYRLDGFDDDWRRVGNQRRARYTNLPNGQFQFRVRAISSARLPSEGEAVLAISIAPRWHERWPVRVGLALVALALLAAFVRWRVRAYRQREERLERMVAERTKELAHANDKLRDANRALLEANRTDTVTGAVSRRFLGELIAPELRAVEAVDGERAVVFAMVDIDYFRRFNERYGQSGGDAILRAFVAALRQYAGPDAAVARWGGEEFLVVLPNVERARASAVIAVLHMALVGHIYRLADGSETVMTSSMGYSVYPVFAQEPTAVPWTVAVELADAACYQVKTHARNAWAGVTVAPITPVEEIADSVAGRVAWLHANARLEWDNLRPRFTTPSQRRGG